MKNITNRCSFSTALILSLSICPTIAVSAENQSGATVSIAPVTDGHKVGLSASGQIRFGKDTWFYLGAESLKSAHEATLALTQPLSRQFAFTLGASTARLPAKELNDNYSGVIRGSQGFVALDFRNMGVSYTQGKTHDLQVTSDTVLNHTKWERLAVQGHKNLGQSWRINGALGEERLNTVEGRQSKTSYGIGADYYWASRAIVGLAHKRELGTQQTALSYRQRINNSLGSFGEVRHMRSSSGANDNRFYVGLAFGRQDYKRPVDSVVNLQDLNLQLAEASTLKALDLASKVTEKKTASVVNQAPIAPTITGIILTIDPDGNASTEVDVFNYGVSDPNDPNTSLKVTFTPPNVGTLTDLGAGKVRFDTSGANPLDRQVIVVIQYTVTDPQGVSASGAIEAQGKCRYGALQNQHCAPNPNR